MRDREKLEELGQIIQAANKYKDLPSVWSHGNTDWQFDEATGLYRTTNFDDAPKQYCLGDRYFYFTGYGNTDIRGSSSDNWHGYNFGYDLKSAVEWAKQAKYADLKWYLWSGFKNKKKDAR